MNTMAQIQAGEVPLSRKCAGYRSGNNVDIVGVPSSILGTPTIHPAASTHCFRGVFGIKWQKTGRASSGIYIVAGRFDKPEMAERLTHP